MQRRVRTAVVTAFSPGGFFYKVTFVLASNARFSTFQNLIMQNMFFLQTTLYVGKSKNPWKFQEVTGFPSFCVKREKNEMLAFKM